MTSRTCFIRGNCIRYIHIPKREMELDLVEEVCKKEHTPDDNK